MERGDCVSVTDRERERAQKIANLKMSGFFQEIVGDDYIHARCNIANQVFIYV